MNTRYISSGIARLMTSFFSSASSASPSDIGSFFTFLPAFIAS